MCVNWWLFWKGKCFVWRTCFGNSWFKNSSLLNPNSVWRVALFSQNQDGPSAFKFHMEQEAAYIYRTMPSMSPSHVFGVCYPHNHYGRASERASHLRKPFASESLSSGKSSLYHSVGRKHSFLYVKFELGVFISFSRKSMTNKKGHFFTDDEKFFFFKTRWLGKRESFSTVMERKKVMMVSSTFYWDSGYATCSSGRYEWEEGLFWCTGREWIAAESVGGNESRGRAKGWCLH